MDHFGKFVVVPHLVHKDAVDTHRENFNAKLLKFRVFLGDRRDFGRSDKREIPGIETEDHPLPKILR
jgi:hypothetical protein